MQRCRRYCGGWRKRATFSQVQGKAHLFSAAVKREQVIKRTVGDFVERLFGGNAIAADAASGGSVISMQTILMS